MSTKISIFNTFIIFCIKLIINICDYINASWKWLKRIPGTHLENAEPSSTTPRLNEELSFYVPRNCQTVMDIWLQSVKRHAKRDAFGTRFVERAEDKIRSDGKVMVELDLGSYIWENYEEGEKRVSALAAGLLNLLGGDGVKPNESAPPNPTPVVLFAETRAEWLYAAEACWRIRRSVATVFPELLDFVFVSAVEQTEATVVITSDQLLSRVVKLLPDCPRVQHVVYLSDGVLRRRSGLSVDDPDRFWAAARRSVSAARRSPPQSVELLDVLEVERRGRAVIGSEVPWLHCESPQPNDVALIAFTGDFPDTPRGTVLTHRNLLSAVDNVLRCLPPLRPKTDVYIAHLPLSQVSELVAELVAVFAGVQIGYSHAQTLSDDGPRLRHGDCHGDMVELQPTLLVTVPKVLDRLAEFAKAWIRDQGPLMQAKFDLALDYKRRHPRSEGTLSQRFLDKIVLNKVRALFGGRLRLVVCGGATLSEELKTFANFCLAPTLLAYGRLETSAVGTLTKLGEPSESSVGRPLEKVELRLVSWPEGGFSLENSPFPCGEILLSGDVVCQGYYKDPEATDEAFWLDENGVRWFCSGDIAELSKDGSLTLLDNKHGQAWLQNGECVSLLRVESLLRRLKLGKNLCVFADPRHDFLICVMSPSQLATTNAGSDLGLIDRARQHAEKILGLGLLERMPAYHPFLCQRPEVVEYFLQRFEEKGPDLGLRSFEIPKKLHLDFTPWTTESGLLTASGSNNRVNIAKKYNVEILQMYPN